MSAINLYMQLLSLHGRAYEGMFDELRSPKKRLFRAAACYDTNKSYPFHNKVDGDRLFLFCLKFRYPITDHIIWLD